MMKLTDLKRTKKEMKSSQPEAATSSNREQYPYGLRINLSTEVLDMLGINLDSVKIGQKVKLEGESRVVSISESQYPDDVNRDISLQIQKIGFDLGKTKMGNYRNQQTKGPGE